MPKPRQPESGFALLLIFCMAAIIGIMLYAATPRVAFEAQRDQEQLLIDRGEQYKRAIQLYYRAFKRYPGRLEDLENTANQRFLRRRYDDPISGKSEWRLVHIGPGGVLVDSVNQKPKKPGTESSVNNFITELQPLGVPAPGAGAAEGVGVRRRPSDQPGAAGNGAPLDPNAIADAAATGVASSVPQPIGPDGRPLATGAGFVGGYPYPNGAAGAANPLGATGVPPGQPSVPPGPPGNNQAAQIIQRLLTSPRPGGFPGQPGAVPTGPNSADRSSGATVPFPTPGSTQPPANASGLAVVTGGAPQQGQNFVGGIAGVASTVEREGIKVYNEKSKYNQWEFLYDFSKEAGAGQVRPAVPVPGASTASPGFGNLPQPGAPPPIKP